MRAYKGFDKDLKCRGFQYEIGGEYSEEVADLCNSGFHACENPMDVFGYYAPTDSRYCAVELDEVSEKRDDDSKVCGKRIKIGEEIGIAGLIKAGVDFIFERIDWKNSKESNTGDRSAATNTGDQSAATNTGNWSAATNTGDQSAATNAGYRSAAIVEGEESVAISLGIDGKAKGALGCFLTIAEWKKHNIKWHRIDVKTVRVDGEIIKPDTFYTLKGGAFVEVGQ